MRPTRWCSTLTHTHCQELLDRDVRIQVALNLTLREDVLIAKVCGDTGQWAVLFTPRVGRR